MSSVSQRWTPLSSPELCIIVCTPCGLHGSFCWSRLPIVGSLAGVDDTPPGWLPGPALCGGCLQLVDGVGSWGGWRSLLLVLWVFSINSFSVNGCNFGVTMGRDNLWIFLFCVIGHSWVEISNVWFGSASLRWLVSNNLKEIQQRYLVITKYCASLCFPAPCN